MANCAFCAFVRWMTVCKRVKKVKRADFWPVPVRRRGAWRRLVAGSGNGGGKKRGVVGGSGKGLTYFLFYFWRQ